MMNQRDWLPGWAASPASSNASSASTANRKAQRPPDMA
jgi:hypothetical protein